MAPTADALATLLPAAPGPTAWPPSCPGSAHSAPGGAPALGMSPLSQVASGPNLPFCLLLTLKVLTLIYI